MSDQPGYLYWLIVGSEAIFWVLLMLALAVRYLLKRDRLSRALLFTLPLVDLLLLLFTALDLRTGTRATFAHGLAMAYVGFTIAFGAVVVGWADQRFAHRFVNGPPPVASPTGWAAVRYELALWLRCIVAAAITVALLIGLIAFVDNDDVTRELHAWFRIALVSVILWFVFGPVWSLVFFRRPAIERRGRKPIFIHYVHDMDRARRFYQSVFEVSPSFSSRGWTTLDFGSFELALHVLAPGHTEEAPLPHAGLNLEVDLIEEMQKRVELNGGTMSELREAERNVPDRVATFRDTEGNGFELRQHMGLRRDA